MTLNKLTLYLFLLLLFSTIVTATYALLRFLYFENLLCCADFVGKAWSVKLTNELCNRIVFSFCADCSCDAVILEDGQEELNEV